MSSAPLHRGHRSCGERSVLQRAGVNRRAAAADKREIVPHAKPDLCMFLINLFGQGLELKRGPFGLQEQKLLQALVTLPELIGEQCRNCDSRGSRSSQLGIGQDSQSLVMK